MINYLLFFGILFLQEIETQVRKEVDEAVKIAKADVEIDMDELGADVYCDQVESLSTARGVLEARPLPLKRIGTAVNV